MIFTLQKASMWKRISAWLLDAILTVIVATLFLWLLSMATNTDGHLAAYEARCDAIAAQYGVSRETTMAQIEAMTEAERANWDEANRTLAMDKEAGDAFSMFAQMTIMNVSLGLFLAFMALEFLVPLFFRNGQTIGKKIFGLAVMRTDFVKVNSVGLFIRSVLGKYTIETMIPVMMLMLLFFGGVGFLGIAVPGLVLIVNLGLLILSNHNAMLHDKLAVTVAVDLASQRIFNTHEDMMAEKTRLHAEKAASQPY